MVEQYHFFELVAEAKEENLEPEVDEICVDVEVVQSLRFPISPAQQKLEEQRDGSFARNWRES